MIAFNRFAHQAATWISAGRKMTTARLWKRLFVPTRAGACKFLRTYSKAFSKWFHFPANRSITAKTVKRTGLLRKTPQRPLRIFPKRPLAAEKSGTHMLILTRRLGESLFVGEDIKITVLSVQGKQVRLGLEVPAQTTVYREEVYLRVREQNRLAIETLDSDFWAATQLWNDKKK